MVSQENALPIHSGLSIPANEISLSAVRSQGAGGQNVNKVASAIHLRFDIAASSLPDVYKKRLLEYRDQRLSKDGVLIIKAQRFRTQEKNRADALSRLQEFVRQASVAKKRRVPTKASASSKKKRLDKKTRRGRTKQLRGRVGHD